TAYEAATRGLNVLILDQESRNNLGGQASWSLGGVFYVDSPEQRLIAVNDSADVASRDWESSAQFGGAPTDRCPKAWSGDDVRCAANEKRSYLKNLGRNVLPTVGWAERGSGDASGHGNSVPRFHLTWGTGPEVVRVFREQVEKLEQEGRIRFE